MLQIIITHISLPMIIHFLPSFCSIKETYNCVIYMCLKYPKLQNQTYLNFHCQYQAPLRHHLDSECLQIEHSSSWEPAQQKSDSSKPTDQNALSCMENTVRIFFWCLITIFTNIIFNHLFLGIFLCLIKPHSVLCITMCIIDLYQINFTCLGWWWCM